MYITVNAHAQYTCDYNGGKNEPRLWPVHCLKRCEIGWELTPRVAIEVTDLFAPLNNMKSLQSLLILNLLL